MGASREREDVRRSEVKVGDVVEVFGVTGCVVRIMAPRGGRRADAGELAFRLATRDGEVSTALEVFAVRRLPPVAADQWMQENLP